MPFFWSKQISTIKQKIFNLYGHREEDERSEGELDPSVELREAAKLLLIGDNQKAELFQGFLAKHFFRGMVEVSKFPYKLKKNKLFLTFHLIFNPKIPNKNILILDA